MSSTISPAERAYTAAELAQLGAALQAVGATWELRCQGRSMEPRLADGALVRLAPLPVAGPRLGEIVAFERHGGLVLHRVLWCQAGRCLCAGDANQHLDGWIDSDTLYGRVVAINAQAYRGHRRLVDWLMAVMRHTRRTLRRGLR